MTRNPEVIQRLGPKVPITYDNVLIGTQKSSIDYGGTMPFVSPPFGMANRTPQTRQNKAGVIGLSGP